MKYFLFIFFLTSCVHHSIDMYDGEEPSLNLRDFFDGRLTAKGIVQDRNKKVIKRFIVDMKATWKNNQLTLDEDFIYSDGSKQKRIWTITEGEQKSYIGEASDVHEYAKGKVKGNAFQFDYTLLLDVDGKNYKVNFEDWMFLLDKKTLLARTYMSKFGFNLGEVTIIMTKN